jgi:hypothetical protein
MNLNLFTVVACSALALPAIAADVSYRVDVAPFIQNQCADCHSEKASAPTLQEFKSSKEAEAKYVKDKVGPRIDTYENLLAIIAYPDSGAFMRRLDDGSSAQAGGKPGNMYKHLGETDAERSKALAMLKAWVGEGGWNLNRWEPRGAVPAVAKEQLDKLKLKY